MMAIHLMLPPTNSRTRPSVEAARSAATAWATSSVVMMEDLRDRRSVGRGDKAGYGRVRGRGRGRAHRAAMRC